EGLEPVPIDLPGQREREQKTLGLGTLGGEVGEVHPQRLLGNLVGGIVGKEMHAANDGVGLGHEGAAGRDGGRRAVIDQSQGRRMLRQRPEIASDDLVLAGLVNRAPHIFLAHPASIAIPLLRSTVARIERHAKCGTVGATCWIFPGCRYAPAGLRGRVDSPRWVSTLSFCQSSSGGRLRCRNRAKTPSTAAASSRRAPRSAPWGLPPPPSRRRRRRSRSAGIARPMSSSSVAAR